MEIVKKNLLSILCGVVALASVVLIFVPTYGWFASLQTKLNQRAADNTKIENLLKAKRMLPLLGPNQTTPGELTVYPTDVVIVAGKEATKKVAQNASDMLDAASKMNQHVLLWPDSLPNSLLTAQYDFARAYVRATSGQAEELQGKVLPYEQWRIPSILNASMRPSKKDIDNAIADMRAQVEKDKGLTNPPELNEDKDARADAEQEIKDKSDDVPRTLQLNVAKKFSVYLEPGAIFWDPTIVIGSGRNPPVASQIWDAQMGMWIAEDVARGVKRANDITSDADPDNKGSVDILHAAVKHIERIDPPMTITAPLLAGIDAKAESELPNDKMASPTGRVSNGMYQVVHFGVTMVVDARKVPQILQCMEYSQLITVLNTQVSVVDPALSAQDGFFYGSQPVVRLQLDCEELLMRDWLSKVMPESRREKAGETGGMRPPGYPGGGYPGGYPGGPGYNPNR